MNQVILETERLFLRRFTNADLPDLSEYLTNPEVVKYEPYGPMNPEEVKANLEWRIATEEMIAVVLKSNQKMIGNIYLGKREFDTLEIGFVFNNHYWGNGYAWESSTALIDYVFLNGIHRVYAECDPDNQRSWKLLEKLGFQKEGHLKQNVYFQIDASGKPVWKDTLIYAKLNMLK